MEIHVYHKVQVVKLDAFGQKGITRRRVSCPYRNHEFTIWHDHTRCACGAEFNYYGRMTIPNRYERGGR